MVKVCDFVEHLALEARCQALEGDKADDVRRMADDANKLHAAEARIAQLECELAEWKHIGEHNARISADLRVRIAQREAILREWLENLGGTDTLSYETRKLLSPLSKSGLGLTAETGEEVCANCGAYKRSEVHICDHPANRYPQSKSDRKEG